MSSYQVPKGYKQTEVGVIPEDWEVTQLKELIDPERQITYGIVVPGPNLPNGIPMIRAQDYSRGWVSIEYLYRVSTEIDKSYKRSKVLTNDVLLTIVGSVGNLAKVPESFSGSNLTQQTARLAFNEKLADADFYLNILGSDFGQREILNYTKSGVQPSLNLSDVDKFRVPYPPLHEQRAIATALSDVDALIAALDKLIAKKRHLKTATMQQLLTGKKRLPGFGEGKWQAFKIGDLFEITAGGDLVKDEYSEIQNDAYPYPIYANSISDKGLYGYSSFQEYEGSCITVTARGTLGVACYRPFPFVAIGRLLVLDPKTKLDGFFISEAINHRVEFANESTGVPQLTAPQIAKYELSLPPVEEQRAIATVLSDMDSEIAAIEARRAKTQAIKQGMMQELLTGRTRLV
jgi:type I restriction enzyme S subunit